MRMLPARWTTNAKPVKVKQGSISQVQHFGAPLKGLDVSSKMSVGDPNTAPILDNVIVLEDRVSVRPGYFKLGTLTGSEAGKPIEACIPWYGQPNALMLATSKAMHSAAGAQYKAGFTSGDWSWTSFSNLGDTTYTVMCNGANGVWSWDGNLVPDPPAVAVTSLTSANPAVVTVAAADIAKFKDGMVVTIAGAVGAGLVRANGQRVITSVGVPANTFTLLGIDTTGSTTQTTGVTANPPGSLFREAIYAPTDAPYVNPLFFNIIMSHQNRLWFADTSNLAIYYLPLQQKSGTVKVIPLNALFKRGGSIRAIYTWSLDGGRGMDDQLVVFTTNGECAIWSGIDPDVDMELVGVFRFDSPMSKNCVVQYGGELWCLISTGLVPMSTMLRAESEQLGEADKKVSDLFKQGSGTYRSQPGWSVILNHTTGRIICNIPTGIANGYRQMVRNMPSGFWVSWSKVRSRSWAWIDNRLFLGSDDGKFFEMNEIYLNDDGRAITMDMQLSWSLFKTVGIKQFKMIRAYVITDGAPKPYMDIMTDYQTTAPTNLPDVSLAPDGAAWDLADWDLDDWAQGDRTLMLWNGVSGIGRVGAPRITVSVFNCTFAISGLDAVYESGSIV